MEKHLVELEAAEPEATEILMLLLELQTQAVEAAARGHGKHPMLKLARLEVQA